MSFKKSNPNNLSHQKSSIKKKGENTNWSFMRLGLIMISIISASIGVLVAISLSSTPLQRSSLTKNQEKVFSQNEAISYTNLRLPKLSRPVNVLILGTKVLTSEINDNKQRKKLGHHALVNSFKGLSDTVVLARFDPITKKLSILSIPRDTQAIIRHEIRKINEANYYGGPSLAAETISNLLGGVPINRYVRFNIQGVEKVIDALGGVNIYVPKNMKYTDHSQHLYINIKEGEQHIDGQKAVSFLRFRYDRYGDIGRVQRQQMFMRALVEQALKPKNLLRIPEILSIINSYIDTNLTVEELVALSGFASQIQRSNVQMLMLPGNFNGNGKHEVSYWLPDHSQIKSMIATYFDYGSLNLNARETTPNSLRIAVQNSTENPKSAQQVADFLKNAGYQRTFVSHEWPENLNKTRIIAQNGDSVGAAALRIDLGIGEVLVESTGNLASDITIIVGLDWEKHYPKSLIPL
ncbi:LCP family protein [Candidatus Atelocyanobacterium thalassae]|uniref:Transcriptional regulator LytR n=1 Tax=cyanobacterium endosymbiont of Braarudosphaera bigelowii TaxID=1285375 RepID=A0ABM7U6I8_9CHRO|nr:LCP family protein [Candidatus Atelocyanobacterium thalassa]BDA40115.1 transcriptional regulator LytR [cyanobacterium endosymbiont of Braarudosphaera bigelowii]